MVIEAMRVFDSQVCRAVTSTTKPIDNYEWEEHFFKLKQGKLMVYTEHLLHCTFLGLNCLFSASSSTSHIQ